MNKDPHASWSPPWMEVPVSDGGGVAGESKPPQSQGLSHQVLLPPRSPPVPPTTRSARSPRQSAPKALLGRVLCAHHPSLRQGLICATRMTRTLGQVLGHRGDRINPASALRGYQSECRLTHQTHRSNSRCPRPSRKPLAAVLLVSVTRVLITSVLQCGESKSWRD